MKRNENYYYIICLHALEDETWGDQKHFLKLRK